MDDLWDLEYRLGLARRYALSELVGWDRQLRPTRGGTQESKGNGKGCHRSWQVISTGFRPQACWHSAGPKEVGSKLPNDRFRIVSLFALGGALGRQSAGLRRLETKSAEVQTRHKNAR